MIIRRRFKQLVAAVTLVVLLFLLHLRKVPKDPNRAVSGTRDSKGIVRLQSRDTKLSSSPDIEASVKTGACKISFDYTDQSRVLLAPKGNFRVDADCLRLLDGNVRYGKLIHRKLKFWKSALSDNEFFLDLTTNCSRTYHSFKDSFYISEKERNFPLAFEMLVYYKPVRVQQYVRLIKNIYRPHNMYCIHVDEKAPDWWREMWMSFASCFPNIILARKSVKVDYGTAKILYAHFHCLKDLLVSDYDWKYAISLHGTELPLVTNREIVEILQHMNGTNVIQKGENALDETALSHDWIRYKVKSVDNGRKVVLTNDTLGPIPYNLTIFKSAASANSAFSRPFVDFMLTDKRATTLADFLNDVQSAVEMFFSTVNLLPDAPGGYHTFLGNDSNMPLVAKRDWVFQRKTFKKYCFGRKLVHNICIVSAADLERLGKASKEKSWWFHNKYLIEYDHVVMNCIENFLLRRNSDEYKLDCK